MTDTKHQSVSNKALLIINLTIVCGILFLMFVLFIFIFESRKTPILPILNTKIDNINNRIIDLNDKSTKLYDIQDDINKKIDILNWRMSKLEEFESKLTNIQK